MPQVGFAIPVLPGKVGIERDALASCWRGHRRAAYEDARRRAGITREAVWIQTMRTGDLVVVHLEADDLDAAYGVLGASPAPFDRWFREHFEDVHGFSLADGVPGSELVLDYDTEV
jgi:hypothetical protein